MGLRERLEAIEVRLGAPDIPEPVTYKVPRENLSQVIKGLVDCGAVRITEDGEPVDPLWAQLDGGISQIVDRMTGKEKKC